MIRTPLILVASLGLLAGCATSSANSTPSSNPDDGKVNYDVGQPSSGSGGTTPGTGGTSPSSPTTKGVDSTSTSAPGIGPKVVKKIAATKPPKTTEPEDPKKPPPKRKGRVDPNGLLGETFALDAGATKLPDFSGAAKTLFLVPNLEQATRFPADLKAPIAARYTGSLNVTAAAEYKLCTTSSDGSKLMIEGTDVVVNDGVHATAVEKCEVVSLEPGEYGVEIQSFHVSATPSLVVSWANTKDGTPAPIPKANFFKPEGADDKVKAAAAKK
jgi:hypothetical protein